MTELMDNSYYYLNTKEAKADKRISFYVIFYFIASALNATIKHAFLIRGGAYSLISVIIGLTIVLFMVIPIRVVWQRSGKLLIEMVLLFSVIYIISICVVLSRGETLAYLLRGTAFLSFAWWIPVGVYASSVKNKEILYKTCLNGSYVISILMTILWFSNYDVEDGSSYSMFMGFALILPLLFHINECFRSRKLLFFVLSLFEILMIVVFANRGVILSIFVFLIYKLLFEIKIISRKIISIIIVILLSIFWMLFFEEIVLLLSNTLASFGIVSRTLNMVLSDSITDSSGREGIWRICYVMIQERPFLGWGLGGEYIEIANRMGADPAEIGIGFSPHNGIIQNFVNFGVIGGLLASIIVIVPMISTHKITDIHTKHLVVIFACASIIPCLVSADGLFTKPEVAVALFLFYGRNKNK